MADLVLVLSGDKPAFLARYELKTVSVIPRTGDFAVVQGKPYRVVRVIVDIDTGEVHIGLEYSRAGVSQLS